VSPSRSDKGGREEEEGDNDEATEAVFAPDTHLSAQQLHPQSRPEEQAEREREEE